MSPLRITADVDAGDLSPTLGRLYGDRWTVRLADGLTLWATRDELVALAERLLDVAVEMNSFDDEPSSWASSIPADASPSAAGRSTAVADCGTGGSPPTSADDVAGPAPTFDTKGKTT